MDFFIIAVALFSFLPQKPGKTVKNLQKLPGQPGMLLVTRASDNIAFHLISAGSQI